MAAFLDKNVLHEDFCRLCTSVLNWHPSNFPENFSFVHFPGRYDLWASAPGLKGVIVKMVTTYRVFDWFFFQLIA